MTKLRLNDMVEIVVAHDYEDWWRLKDCQFLFVRPGTTELMGEDYQSKWWRYFEGENPILSPKSLVHIDGDPDLTFRRLRKIFNDNRLIMPYSKLREREGRTYED